MDNTGGSAFPHHIEHPNGHWPGVTHAGMTLRDYFAAKAIPALLELWHKDLSEDGDPDFSGLQLTDNEDGTPYMIAEEAYAIADAMLHARSK